MLSKNVLLILLGLGCCCQFFVNASDAAFSSDDEEIAKVAEMKPEWIIRRFMSLEEELKRSIDTSELGMDFAKDQTLVVGDGTIVTNILRNYIPEQPEDASELAQIILGFKSGTINADEIRKIIDETSSRIEKYLTIDCSNSIQNAWEELDKLSNKIKNDKDDTPRSKINNQYVESIVTNLGHWLPSLQAHCNALAELDRTLNYDDGDLYDPLSTIEAGLSTLRLSLENISREADKVTNVYDSFVSAKGDLSLEMKKKLVTDFKNSEGIPQSMRDMVWNNRDALTREELNGILLVNAIQKTNLTSVVDFANEAKKFGDLGAMEEHFRMELQMLSAKDPYVAKLQEIADKFLNRLKVTNALVGRGMNKTLGNQYRKILVETVRDHIVRDDGWILKGNPKNLSPPISNVLDAFLAKCVDHGLNKKEDVERINSAIERCIINESGKYYELIKIHAKDVVTKKKSWNTIDDIIGGIIWLGESGVSKIGTSLSNLFFEGTIDSTTILTAFISIFGSSGIYYFGMMIARGTTRKNEPQWPFNMIPPLWYGLSAIPSAINSIGRNLPRFGTGPIPIDFTNENGWVDRFQTDQRQSMEWEERLQLNDRIKADNKTHRDKLDELIKMLEQVDITLYETTPPRFSYKDDGETRRKVGNLLDAIDANNKALFKANARPIFNAFDGIYSFRNTKKERRIVYLVVNSIRLKPTSCIIS